MSGMGTRRRMVETRRLYRFEDVFTKDLPAAVSRNRSLSFLRGLAHKVWAKHGRARTGAPEVMFGGGTPHGGHSCSFSEGYGYIELTKGQRNVVTLLHELTHSLGFGAAPNGHGRGFATKYKNLLVEYGGCHEGELVMAMSMFRIKT